MPRLIDADALLGKMKLLCVGDCSECDYNTFLSVDIHCGLIDEQPTIEAVQVVHGEVVTKVGDWGVMHQECSVCGEGLEWKSYPNFCPNCGADLRKKV